MVNLNWDAPVNDGGAPIEYYIVESKEQYSSNWVKCFKSDGPVLEGKVTDGLTEGKGYQFRVKAVNKAGPGEASEPTKQVY